MSDQRQPDFPKDARFVMDPVSPDESKRLTIIYALYAASFFVGITFFAALLLNVLWKPEFRSELSRIHARWQLRSGLFALLWGVIGGISLLFLVGWLIIGLAGIWLIYRLVRGWLALSDQQPPKPGFGLS
ncbi:hypothetical protein MIB92_13015 [Aestuariirhabdus sp. Z084]|uniref:DUF4870 family protein n=1 Tax=Aestuariirhabdus haliotis TaxID=2918751 RepID=UPI00201B3B2C|nr:hypothetical protein [Aestuariirhabdus haliotis]MCL6416573.1 hypothetical protein [Aestuariirhabdus haliotis]MCL6420560.1 hypothetical protein [Aestuariirhabdus haliotis]